VACSSVFDVVCQQTIRVCCHRAVAREEERERPEAATLHFRHRCDDAWYEALIAAEGLRGKKITPARLRRLLVGALERYREEQR